MAPPQSSPADAPPDPQVLALRVPPHSLEAEQSVLGGLLLDNNAFDRIGDVVAVDDFYRDDHRRIFRHIAKLVEQAKPADVVTVSESIDGSDDKDKTGGLAYLGSLAQNTPSAHNIRRYAEIVRERAVTRRLIAVANDIADNAFSPQGKDVGQLLDEAESKIFEIADLGAKGRQGFVELQPLLAQVMERIDTLYHRENPSDVTGVPTGFNDLDTMTSGLQEGDLVIVAGRPSMGKAQPLDARVKTLTGWKPMGDLQLGDALASVDGRPSVVAEIFPQGEREVFRITFADGRSTECCDEHLWQVQYRDWDAPRVLPTSKLRQMLERARYRGRLWIEPPSGEFGHHEPLPIDPWVLGALLGDGKLSGTGLIFSTAAAEMVARLEEKLGDRMRVRHAHAYDYRVTRGAPTLDRPRRDRVNPVIQALREVGLWEIGSAEKFIPPQYLLSHRAARLDLLRGLLDTDGWVEKFGSVRFCTTSYRLARDVVELARSIGAFATLADKRTAYTYKSERREGRPAFVVNISHPEPRSLMLLSDKQARAPEKMQRRARLTIGSITPSRRTSTQCIAVSHPSHLYITDDYVTTHNTAFSLNIAEYVAVEQRLPVAVFSMEMGGAQLAMRMLGSVGRLDQSKLRTAKLTDDDWGRLTHAVGKLHDAPMHIDESAGLNSLELKARARRLHRQYGKLGLIVIDYLQLMSAAKEGENRATEISEISRSLKSLAKELKVPVIALSQLNRGLEQRPNKRPIMSDLRECVAGDTLVLLADGRRVPIATLVGTEPEVLAMDEAGRIVRAHSDRVWRVGTKPVFDVVLASGRRVRATGGHRVYTGRGWLTVDEVHIGERMAIGRRQPVQVTPAADTWTDDALVHLAEQLGKGQRSHERHLPDAVFTLDDRRIGLLLRHLWATDGCIAVRATGRGAPRVYFSSVSERLVRDVAALLLRLGIVARIRAVTSGSERPVWTADVSGSNDQRLFLARVGAFGPRVVPAERLREWLDAHPHANTNVDTLPIEVFGEVKASMRAAGMTQRAMASARGTAYGGTSHFMFAPSRATLASYADLLDDPSLLRHVENDLFWDRVVAIEPAGVEDVYDLTVPGPASWLADGVVVHNSGAIEQDADLILFIYRDEVYNPDSPDKGKAEIIIAKQRNGPIGMVPLTFLGQYTRFENFASGSNY